MNVSRRITMALGLTAALAAAWLLLHHECASGGAMAGWYRTCTCRGFERVDFDATAADGPRRTVCFGWVTSRTCYRSRGGPEIPCEALLP
jgi:hypothetical protein